MILDSQTEGMAFILMAYELVGGVDLFSNLGKLTEEDLEQVKQIISETIPRPGTNTTILERVLSLPRIPEQHTFLLSIINEAFDYKHQKCSIEHKQGAVAMFRILANLWPRLIQLTSEPKKPPFFELPSDEFPSQPDLQ